MSHRTVRGTSLIEVLVAMSVSLLLFGLLGAVYVATERQHRLQETLAFLYHDLSLGLELIEHELQLAGYLGCLRLSSNSSVASLGEYSLTAENRINFYVDEKGSMKLTVRHRSLLTSLLLSTMTNAEELEVSGSLHVNEGDVLVISDCFSAEIFRVKEIQILSQERARLLVSRPLKKRYRETAEVGFFEENSYFIGKTGRKTSKGEPQYGLFLEDIKGDKSELVEDIEKLNFLLSFNEEQRVSGVSLSLGAARNSFFQTEYGFVKF